MIVVSCRQGFWHPSQFAGRWEHQIRDVDTSESIPESDFIPRLRDSRTLLLVHGYNNDQAAVLGAFATVEKKERRWIRHYSHVVGFTWPGGDSWDDYVEARDNVPDAAVEFGRLLQALLEHCREVDVMSHSLGGRISLIAYNDLPNGFSHLGKPNRQFLLAPAVHNDSIETGGAYYRASERSTSCHVFYSLHDAVLSAGYPGYEQGAHALGCTGPSRRKHVAPEVYLANCLHAVRGHSAYKSTKKIYKYIQKVVRGERVPKYVKFPSLPDDRR